MYIFFYFMHVEQTVDIYFAISYITQKVFLIMCFSRKLCVFMSNCGENNIELKCMTLFQILNMSRFFADLRYQSLTRDYFSCQYFM